MHKKYSLMSLPTWLSLKIKSPHEYSYKPSSRLIPSSIPPKLNLPFTNHSECPNILCPPTDQNVAAIVFGDGSNSRLYPLTKRRSEAALPIAGNYRLIDAVISNCINSNIKKIYALTQFNSASLNSHLSRAYSCAHIGNEALVDVIAAYQSPEGKGWFQGTADAIRRCLWVLEEYPIVDFLVLPGYHLYKMDFQELLKVHCNNKADITVAVLSRRTDKDIELGTFQVNSENQVISFKDNPEIRVQNSDISQDLYAGMDIYVVNKDAMIKLLTEYHPMANDLRREVVPGAISLGMNVYAHKFSGYWEDMRSIEAYYQANMESIKNTKKAYSLYDKDSPLYTLPRHLPPTQITDAAITDSVIGDGCFLNGCKIRGTVVGMKTRVGDGAIIEDSVIMGSDTYQSGRAEEDIHIPIGIGEGSQIKKAIIDKNVRIGKNVKILNKENVQECNNEANGYIITKGIVVIMKGAIIPDGSIL
ncbi:inactive glucose-1-phosphate adenylyltransferase small subunit 2, chloroplastic-like [Solanum stenotomum]|uniref:inactive glucose-1-phosphate adenylyltransferase small subunit 2, chloroplastic-like n=1 Tax=Solanum stenotomum TaxID=172797 RepID=UPI0020D08170|nr:inactive glucose-1-phosphate adenylyltransferase small subunit 2, chloroplastic-like [Solanum stenotomum]